MKLKRMCSALLAVSVFATAVTCTGCSGGTSSNNTSSASSAASQLSGSITVTSWDAAQTALQACAKEFMSENPGTTVNVQAEDKTYKRLYKQLDDSTLPDVVTMQNRDVASFVNKYPDAFLDVLDLMRPQEKNFSSYVKGLMIVKNKYYAVPWDMGPCALYYRKDIFKAAGVDTAAIKTYDDYIAAGKKIIAKTNGKTKLLGFDFSGSSSTDYMLLLFSQLGGKYYDNDGKAYLNSNEMMQAFSLEKKFITSGVAMNLSNEWDDRITALTNDRIATVSSAVWYAGTLQNIKAQSGKWGIMPLPAYKSGGNTEANVGGSALAISSKTKNAALAKAFVKFSLISSKGCKINFDTSKLFTSYTPAYSDAEYKSSDSFFGVSLGGTFSQYSTKIPTMNFGAYFTDINNGIKTAQNAILIQNQDPQTILKSISSSTQKTIESE